MKKKEIKLSLVYRDMWQASGKYVPRKDQLEKVVPHIIEMGCFAQGKSGYIDKSQFNLITCAKRDNLNPGPPYPARRGRRRRRGQ